MGVLNPILVALIGVFVDESFGEEPESLREPPGGESVFSSSRRVWSSPPFVAGGRSPPTIPLSVAAIFGVGGVCSVRVGLEGAVGVIGADKSSGKESDGPAEPPGGESVLFSSSRWVWSSPPFVAGGRSPPITPLPVAAALGAGSGVCSMRVGLEGAVGVVGADKSSGNESEGPAEPPGGESVLSSSSRWVRASKPFLAGPIAAAFDAGDDVCSVWVGLDEAIGVCAHKSPDNGPEGPGEPQKDESELSSSSPQPWAASPPFVAGGRSSPRIPPPVAAGLSNGVGAGVCSVWVGLDEALGDEMGVWVAYRDGRKEMPGEGRPSPSPSPCGAASSVAGSALNPVLDLVAPGGAIIGVCAPKRDDFPVRPLPLSSLSPGESRGGVVVVDVVGPWKLPLPLAYRCSSSGKTEDPSVGNSVGSKLVVLPRVSAAAAAASAGFSGGAYSATGVWAPISP